MGDCELRASNGIPGVHCEGDQCVYWRVVGHLGVTPTQAGCAIQYFDMLEGADSAVAQWLLSVKQRVENGGMAQTAG